MLAKIAPVCAILPEIIYCSTHSNAHCSNKSKFYSSILTTYDSCFLRIMRMRRRESCKYSLLTNFVVAEIRITTMEVFYSKCISLYIYLCIGNYFARGTILNLSNNNLTDVPPPPINITTVSTLYLQHNFIQQLHRNAFKKYTDLTYFNLNANGLRIIHDGVFENISTLTHLYLQNNDIVKLPANCGQSRTTLFSLYLANGITNPQILIYPYFGAFTRLRVLLLTGLDTPNAHVLHLTHGKMGSFPFLSQWVPNKIEFLLRSYQLQTIPQKGVAGLYQLKYFAVSHNKIVNFLNFSHCKQLKGINLEHNKLVIFLENMSKDLIA